MQSIKNTSLSCKNWQEVLLDQERKIASKLLLAATTTLLPHLLMGVETRVETVVETRVARAFPHGNAVQLLPVPVARLPGHGAAKIATAAPVLQVLQALQVLQVLQHHGHPVEEVAVETVMVEVAVATAMVEVATAVTAAMAQPRPAVLLPGKRLPLLLLFLLLLLLLLLPHLQLQHTVPTMPMPPMRTRMQGMVHRHLLPVRLQVCHMDTLLRLHQVMLLLHQ
jgi:hypothetical protein